MATENLAAAPQSFVAGADLSSVQYRFVKLHTTAGQVVTCNTGDQAVGVLQGYGRTSGYAVAVARYGTSKVTAGETLTAGQKLAAGASGVAIPWVAGYAVAGWAEAASVTSGIVSVTLATFGGTA